MKRVQSLCMMLYGRKSAYEHWRASTVNSADQDPALFDEELQRKLAENQRIGKSRLEEVSVCWLRINELANRGWKR